MPLASVNPGLQQSKKKKYHSLYRIVAIINIYFQAVFPVIYLIIPASVGSTSLSGFGVSSLSLSALPVRSYVLVRGETTSVVARRAGLTLAQLKQLNQFRTFHVPFEQLGEGSEIDVPVPLPASPPIQEEGQAHQQQQGKEIAQWLSGNASGIQSARKANQGMQKYAGASVRSGVTSQVQGATEFWLSQFGTTRVQLGTNDNFSLGESSLDILVPLHDDARNLWFAQAGARYQSHRATVNLGTGFRWFNGKWMYGANTFFDNDLTGYNQRLGAGVELWTDYLRFSGNTYFRLTSWHQSRDLEDYDERPANGFDIVASGWLPAYPQLGGKVKYEKYFGNEVAMTDADTRRNNPHTLTLGLNYTPVPLFTLGTDFTQGGRGDGLQVNAQFTWRLGENLAGQLSGDAVAASRTLAGGRLDLVERNNNIVLEYRRQELLRLSLPDSVHGYGSGVQALTATVMTKYGLDHIEWQLPPEFTAGGGNLTALDGVQFQLRLPAWQSAGNNQYVLTAIAWDLKGNASEPVRVLLAVDRAGADAARTSLLMENDGPMMADGHSTRRLILTARDSWDNPVTGQAESIVMQTAFAPTMETLVPSGGRVTTILSGGFHDTTTSPGEGDATPTAKDGGIRLGGFSETYPGVYEAVLTAGVLPGELTATARIDGQQPAPLKVQLEGPALADARESTLTVDRNELMADGIDKVLLTLSLKSSGRQALPGHKVMFISSRQHGIVFSNVTAQPDGTYTAELSGTEPGSLTVAVSVDGIRMALPQLTFMLSQRVLRIVRDGQLLKDRPKVGDILTVSEICSDSSVGHACAMSASTYQWEVEDAPGSGHYIPVKGATTERYVVTRDIQKRSVRVVGNH